MGREKENRALSSRRRCRRCCRRRVPLHWILGNSRAPRLLFASVTTTIMLVPLLFLLPAGIFARQYSPSAFVAFSSHSCVPFYISGVTRLIFSITGICFQGRTLEGAWSPHRWTLLPIMIGVRTRPLSLFINLGCVLSSSLVLQLLSTP